MAEQEEFLFFRTFLGIKEKIAKGDLMARDRIAKLKMRGARELTMKLIVDGKEAGHRASGIVFDTSLNSDVGWMEEKGGDIITKSRCRPAYFGSGYYGKGIAKTVSEAYNRMIEAAIHTYLNAKNIAIELNHGQITEKSFYQL